MLNTHEDHIFHRTLALMLLVLRLPFQTFQIEFCYRIILIRWYFHYHLLDHRLPFFFFIVLFFHVAEFFVSEFLILVFLILHYVCSNCWPLHSSGNDSYQVLLIVIIIILRHRLILLRFHDGHQYSCLLIQKFDHFEVMIN